MASGAGIQELMAAETRASQIVAEARMGEWRDLCREEALSSSMSSHAFEWALASLRALQRMMQRIVELESFEFCPEGMRIWLFMV